tara:strand:+ start:790 stop:1182 length:393 start_codon:yes stop_codon:yes gene_type:complete
MKRFTSFIKEASNIDITYRSNIAVPTLSEKDLRENYISGKIFQIGSIVENLNTGVVGKIIRTGTNYVICVTEDNEMFKAWITNIAEVHEIGTDEYRKYLQKITPNQPVRDFINKNKKNIANSKKNARSLG